MASRRSPRTAWTAAALALVVIALMSCDATPPVVVDPPLPTGTVSQLVVGVTHTEIGADGAASASAVAPSLAVLKQIPLQNQHLMGWGTLNPEATPGTYDWTSLDARIAQIRSSGAEPSLTLCCAPDWMKGGAAGTTDWSKLDQPPTAAHVADFAALAAKAAQRYPDVRSFQVWNEMKGFYDPATNAWDAAAYTRLYNAVYDAVKAVRPDARIGGPYAPMDIWSDPATMSNPSTLSGPWGTVDQRSLDVITYWLANAHGADFINVDGRITTRDKGLITDPFTATEVFSAITDWIHARSPLPVWWSEVHTSDANPQWSPAQQDAVATVAFANLARSGAAVALLWQPQADGPSCGGCLWSDPRSGPAQPTPLAATVAAWARCVPAGSGWTTQERGTVDTPFQGGTALGTFVVNRSAAARQPLVDGAPTYLAGYQVQVVSKAAACWR